MIYAYKKVVPALFLATACAALMLGATPALGQETQTGTTTGTSTQATTTTPGLPNTGIGGTGTTTGSQGATTTPGLPNTGTGGDTSTVLATLGILALIAVGAAVLLARTRTDNT